MVINGLGWLVALGLALGAGVGGWLFLRASAARNERQLQTQMEDLQQRNAALAEQLSAAQARSDAELTKLREAHKRQIQTLDAVPKAALVRAEESLAAAYDELDRMRADHHRAGAPTEPAELGDGFAATRPFPRNR